MVNIGRPFTEGELKYIENHKEIIESGDLDQLITASVNPVRDLIYFLAKALRGELKFAPIIPAKNGEQLYYLNSSRLIDPLELGKGTPLRLLVRLSNRFQVEPENLRKILVETGIVEDG